MAEEINIISEQYLPIPVVKKILDEYRRRVEAVRSEESLEETIAESTLRRTYDYLEKVSKCSAEKAEQAVEKLKEKGLKEVTAVMFVNIVPRTVDEARPLLVFEERVLTTEELEEILRILHEYCSEETES